MYVDCVRVSKLWRLLIYFRGEVSIALKQGSGTGKGHSREGDWHQQIMEN